MADMLNRFADDLRSVREEKNLSLRTISQQTRLNIAILENLESGDYTFQPQAYIRAFLKQYINALGLDVEEVLFDYDLARSGKYKPKTPPREFIDPPSPKTEEREITVEDTENEKKEDAPKPADETISDEDTEKKINPPVNPVASEKMPLYPPDRKQERKESKPEVKHISESSEKRTSSSKPDTNRNKKLSFSLLGSPVVRNIALIIFIGLVLLGIYSIVNISFLEGSKDKPEVIRQNFDDVVKEQEKRILGKRTPEEIQDSIRKAEQELAAAMDSITLKVITLNDGVIYISADSANYGKPLKVEYAKNETRTYRAKDFFHLSSANTGSFRATVNDKPLKFDRSSISKIKINKDGIVK